MKVQIVFAVVLFFACAAWAQTDEVNGGEVEIAEEEAIVEPVILLRCLIGQTVNGTGNVTESECSPSDDVCQTKIEVRDGTTRIWKECKPKKVCRNNAKNNKMECHSKMAEEKGIRVCFSCCGGDVCNQSDEIQPPK